MSIQNFLTSPPRILTYIRVLCSALIVSLFVLSAYAQDTNTVTRTNASGTVTGTGTDVATVQTAEGFANGDVLTLSGDATHHNSGVNLTSAYNTFTVQSDSTVKHTITAANTFYYVTENGNYTINLSNLNLRGSRQFIVNRNSDINADLTLNVDNVFYTNGYSYTGGGVILFRGDVQFSSGKFTFQDNQSTANGGAIWVTGDLTFSGSTATFIGNRSRTAGGAIEVKDEGAHFSNGTYIFQDNIATANPSLDLVMGGAIYISGRGGCTFSGDGTTATFKGNIATTTDLNKLQGNDIYCRYNLSFTDRGKYSFDGGIYARGNTSINQAQVTIAGRQFRPDDPTVEDITNYYDFSNATISNGGTLTANMDYINRLIGTFTLSDAESLITMNKGSDTATIKSSTGNGVATLNFTSDVETISISSGRIDVKGAMEASLTLQNDATFSPGNSVGTLDLDGDFIANSGILLFEQDATGMDKLIANSYTIGNGVQLKLVFGAPLSEDTYTMYDIIVANNGFTTEQSDVSFWEDLLTGALPEGMRMSVVGGNTVRLEIGPKPVPEPTTWALLILGAAGLAYMRKRSRQ